VRTRTRDVIHVLTETRRAHQAGASPLAARKAAIAEVARLRGIRPETVRAACARGLRPDVQTLTGFDEIVTAWLSGDARRLAGVLLPRLAPAEKPSVERLLDPTQPL
jgi:hypothetical protein